MGLIDWLFGNNEEDEEDWQDQGDYFDSPGHGKCPRCGGRLSEKGSCLNSDCPGYDDSNPMNWDH